MGCLKLFEEAERIPWQVHKKGESSSKAYVYAYNNPVNFSDPAGLVPRGRVPIPTAVTNEHERSGGNGGSRTGWNNFSRLLTRHNPANGNYWSNYANAAVGNHSYNMGVMSGSDFRDFYGLQDEYGNIDYGKATDLAMEMLSSGEAGGTSYTVTGVNGMGDGKGNIIPGTEVYKVYENCRDCNFFQKYADAWAKFFESFGRMWEATMVPPDGWGYKFSEFDEITKERKDRNKVYVETDEWAVEDPVYREGVLEWDNTQPLLGKIFRLWGPKIDSNINSRIDYTESVFIPDFVDPLLSPDTLDRIIQGGIDQETKRFFEEGQWLNLSNSDSTWWEYHGN